MSEPVQTDTRPDLPAGGAERAHATARLVLEACVHRGWFDAEVLTRYGAMTQDRVRRSADAYLEHQKRLKAHVLDQGNPRQIVNL